MTDAKHHISAGRHNNLANVGSRYRYARLAKNNKGRFNMCSKSGIAVLLLLATVLFFNVDARAEPATEESSSDVHPYNIPHGDFCFLIGVPPANVHYTKIKRMKVAKKTYGLMGDLLKEFAEKASSLGADAIINYAGSQRFGFFPWRMIRPAARGQAVKWESPKPDCKAMGGATLQDILSSNDGPHRPERK